MRLRSPEEIIKGVHQLRVFAGKVTVITTEAGAVLVDAGPRGSLKTIASGLEALGLSPESVALVVITHHHPDHAGGLAELVEATAARVAVHSMDAGVVSGKEPNPGSLNNPLLAKVTRPLMPLLYGPAVEVDYRLEDQDRLPVDPEITVVHTPGHTPGSICLYVASDKLLIAGDALQHKSGTLSPPASPVTQDMELAVESLGRLIQLEVDTICFSHFPPLRGNIRESLQRLVLKKSA